MKTEPLWTWKGLLYSAIVGLILGAFAAEVQADEQLYPFKETYVAEHAGNKLFIMPEPCPLGGWFGKWGKARWIFQGQTYEACWRIERDPDGLFVKTVDSDGATGSMPLLMFKKDEGV